MSPAEAASLHASHLPACPLAIAAFVRQAGQGKAAGGGLDPRPAEWHGNGCPTVKSGHPSRDYTLEEPVQLALIRKNRLGSPGE